MSATGGRVRRILAHLPALLLGILLLSLYAETLGFLKMFQWDEAEYALVARSFLVDGEIGHGYRLPVFPLSVAAAAALGGDLRESTLLKANLFWAALALLAIYVPLWRAHGVWAGVSGVAFLGFAPGFWTAGAQLLTETAFMGLFAVAIFALGEGLWGCAAFLPLAWVAAGLASLTRYNGLFFLPLALIVVACGLVARPAVTLPRVRSRVFLLSPLCFAALLGLWIVDRHASEGNWLGGFLYATKQLSIAPGEAGVRPWSEYLRILPGYFGPVGCLFALSGVVAAVALRERVALLALLVSAFNLIYFSATPPKTPRFILGLFPFAAVLAAVGLSAILRLTPTRLRAALAIGVLLLQMGLSIGQVVPFLRSTRTLGHAVLPAAARFISDNSGPQEACVSALPPQTAWYSGRRTHGVPGDPARLAPLLDRSSWLLVVNFERGQPEYLRQLTGLVQSEDYARGDAIRFVAGRQEAWVIRSSLLRSRLATPEDSVGKPPPGDPTGR